MKTLQEVIDWLKTANRNVTILVEITGIQGGPSSSLYLANKPYVTKNTDIPPNQAYTPCIVGGISFTESLSLDFNTRANFGDLEIDNTEGNRDQWFDWNFVNRPINIYIGDITWPRQDFRLIFSGLVEDLSSRNRSSINIILVDKLKRFNNPVTEELLPQVNTTNDVIMPLTFGEVFNITPILADNVINTLEYIVHDGPIEDVIEVRDNGIPVPINKDLANGRFSLQRSPYGQITCSIQGHKDTIYYNNIADLIKEIVTKYGPEDTRFTLDDIDLANFTTFANAHPQPVGIYARAGETVITMCNDLAVSVGAQLTINSLGKLRLVKLEIPGSGQTYTIDLNDVEQRSVRISNKPEVVAATKIGYVKNWTPAQGTIAAGVPSHNLYLFEEEWLYESAVNTTTQENFKLPVEVDAEYTMLQAKEDALTEAQRRNDLWSQPRFVFSMTAYPHLLGVELGDRIILKDNRFGLYDGKEGIAIQIQRDWLRNRVTLGVLV